MSDVHSENRGKGKNRNAEREKGGKKRDSDALIMHRARALLRAQHIITVYLAFKFREAKMLFNSIPWTAFNIHIGSGVIYLQIYRTRARDYRVTMLIRRVRRPN